jgi:hypothetical protein
MGASAIVVFGLASIIFLSMMLLGAALLLRGQWSALASASDRERQRRTRNKYAPRLPE